jgi:capsid assembly protease
MTDPTVIDLNGRSLAVRPELLALLSDLNGKVFRADDLPTEATLAARRGAGPSVAGGVATVDLKGLITPEPSLLAMLFGLGGGLNAFMDDLRSAVADPDVGTVVMNVNSPGGYVDGVPEASAQIRQLRESKPIVAVANTLAASAAYWLASQAHELVVTPSGEVGSIGVYQMHQDISKALDLEGVKPTLISAGKYKVEGNPFEPLDPEAAAYAQSQVDDFYNLFTADVAAGRGVAQDEVTSGYGEGRTLTAKRAVRAGMADRVATLAETQTRFQSGRGRVKQRAEDTDPQKRALPSYEDRLRLVDALAG